MTSDSTTTNSDPDDDEGNNGGGEGEAATDVANNTITIMSSIGAGTTNANNGTVLMLSTAADEKETADNEQGSSVFVVDNAPAVLISGDEEVAEAEEQANENNANNKRTYNNTSKNKKKRHWLIQFLRDLPQMWPRTFALAFGVVTPVLLLICIALFFGFFLAELEAPAEIDHNNAVIATRFGVSFASNFLGNVTTAVPRICLSMVVRNRTGDPNFDIETEIDEELYKIFVRDDDDESSEPFNVTQEENIRGISRDAVQEMFEFMQACGELVYKATERFTADHPTANDIESLSFSWIQCDGAIRNDTEDTSRFNRIFGSYVDHPFRNITRLRPDVQEAAVVNEWTQHQRELYDEYIQAHPPTKNSTTELIDAKVKALKQSADNANGFSNCISNPNAGAWFWFTVMTTIGYGNTAPITLGGRAMVYSIGFLSILTFAVVLGNAGRIVTTIFDDWVDRVQILAVLRRNWAACLFWGLLYYGWMGLLAWQYQKWKEERLGEDFDFHDAYWYSFITSTTVGLGDFFLEHQVLLRRDLIGFSLLILVAFIFLSDFLVKLTEIIVGFFPKKQSSLENAVKETNMLSFKKKQNTESAAMNSDTDKA